MKMRSGTGETYAENNEGRDSLNIKRLRDIGICLRLDLGRKSDINVSTVDAKEIQEDRCTCKTRS